MWIATVTRTSSSQLWVRVPDLDPRREFGPLDALTGVTVTVGDRVLVAALTKRTETLVLLRHMP